MAPVQIATSDKVGAWVTIARAFAAALTQLVTAPFRSGPKPKDLYKTVMFAALRELTGNMSIAGERYLGKSSEANYLDFAKGKGFQPDSLVLSDGTKAHWLGAKSVEKVIIFFHGGGYVLTCSAGHYRWLFNVTQHLARSHSISSIMLGYTCAPEGQYPLQLSQAAELVQHLIEKEGKKPSDIILAGDSAGGNLTMSVLSHILHPHPEVPTKISLSEPLAGAVLISPWIDFNDDHETYSANEKTDLIGIKGGKRWSSAFLGDAPRDNYNQPCLADADWFKDLESVVSELLIWGGGGEVLIRGINDIAKALKNAHSKTQYVVEPGAGHTEPIIEAEFGYKTKAQGTIVIEEWIASRLS